MTTLTPEAATRRFRNRLIVAAFGVAAMIFIVGPFAIRWYGSRDFCEDVAVTAKGRSGGTDWEVTRSNCGGDVGIVWQLRIIPTKGTSWVAYDARNGGPEPLGYEQKGYSAVVRLAGPLPGSTEDSVAVPLDHRGRPVAAIKVAGGKRIE